MENKQLLYINKNKKYARKIKLAQPKFKNGFVGLIFYDYLSSNKLNCSDKNNTPFS